MKALRFSPPEIAWTPELRWILARAFGAPTLHFGEPFDVAEAVRLATVFNLAPRIGARTPEAVLASEAGAEAALFRRAAHLTVAQNLYRLEAVRAVARTAEKGGIPFVILKGLALEALQLVPPGARPTSDLDLLVPERLIPRFLELLVTDGWVPSENPDQEQHLDPLIHPRLGMIEVHRLILGVRLSGSRRSLDHDTLSASGLTQPIPGFPELVTAPVGAILLAHALVHGLVQHGNAPGSYPLFRVLTDVVDLGSSPEALAQAGAYLREIDAEDLAAVGNLARGLRSGLPSALSGAPYSVEGRPDPEVGLLRHIVAGTLDADYALGLKVQGVFGPISDLPSLPAALRATWQALALSRKQVDKIYGPPRTRLGYLGRQLARPFDLAGRLVRSLAARRR